VGRQVLDHADICDARRERALPSGGDLEHLAEFARFESAPGLLERRVVTLDVTDRTDEPGCFEGVGELRRAGGIGRQRLLDQRVDAGRRQRQGELCVERRGRRDDAVVQTEGDDVVDACVDRRRARDAVGIACGVYDGDEFGSLAAYVWSFEPDVSSRPKVVDRATLMTLSTSPESVAMSKDLRKRGWAFVGPTTLYAMMQSNGIVNDHLAGCQVRAEVERERAARQQGQNR